VGGISALHVVLFSLNVSTQVEQCFVLEKQISQPINPLLLLLLLLLVVVVGGEVDYGYLYDR
jgi:hypothetical protein